MIYSNWPAAQTTKSADELTPGEIFRFGDNRLGLAFKGSSSGERFPWTQLIDLNTFSIIQYEDFNDVPDQVYTLGKEWILLLGGEAAECSDSATPAPGTLVVDGRGTWLTTNASRRYFLAGSSEHNGRMMQTLPATGLFFKKWTLVAKSKPESTFEVTTLRFGWDAR